RSGWGSKPVASRVNIPYRVCFAVPSSNADVCLRIEESGLLSRSVVAGMIGVAKHDHPRGGVWIAGGHTHRPGSALKPCVAVIHRIPIFVGSDISVRMNK